MNKHFPYRRHVVKMSVLLTKGQQLITVIMDADITLTVINSQSTDYHDDVIKWKHFPRNWPLVRGIHRSPVNSPHKGQWRGALMFSLICSWIEPTNEQTMETPVIWDATALIMMSFWCAKNGLQVPAPCQFWRMISKANVFFYFLK